MAEQTIVIHVNGFWRDQQREDLRESPGIFFVYEAAFNESGQTVDLLNLVFIGEADNIRKRILDDENRILWNSYIDPSNELVYAYAPVDACFRERVRDAYVITHKPRANQEDGIPFRYDKTTLVSYGKAALLNPVTTVRRSSPVLPDNMRHRLSHDTIPVRSVHVFSGKQADRRYAVGK
jgi:hypothetical protein